MGINPSKERSGLHEEVLDRNARHIKQEQTDNSLLSGCQPHLSTFTSPPSTTEKERATERDGEGENRHVNVASVDTVSRYVILIACQSMRGAHKCLYRADRASG